MHATPAASQTVAASMSLNKLQGIQKPQVKQQQQQPSTTVIKALASPAIGSTINNSLQVTKAYPNQSMSHFKEPETQSTPQTASKLQPRPKLSKPVSAPSADTMTTPAATAIAAAAAATALVKLESNVVMHADTSQQLQQYHQYQQQPNSKVQAVMPITMGLIHQNTSASVTQPQQHQQQKQQQIKRNKIQTKQKTASGSASGKSIPTETANWGSTAVSTLNHPAQQHAQTPLAIQRQPQTQPQQQQQLKQQQQTQQGNQPAKRYRTTPAQFRWLIEIFRKNPNPSSSAIQMIAKDLAMPPNTVFVWFKNQRARNPVFRAAAGAASNNNNSNNQSHNSNAHSNNNSNSNTNIQIQATSTLAKAQALALVQAPPVTAPSHKSPTQTINGQHLSKQTKHNPLKPSKSIAKPGHASSKSKVTSNISPNLPDFLTSTPNMKLRQQQQPKINHRTESLPTSATPLCECNQCVHLQQKHAALIQAIPTQYNDPIQKRASTPNNLKNCNKNNSNDSDSSRAYTYSPTGVDHLGCQPSAEKAQPTVPKKVLTSLMDVITEAMKTENTADNRVQPLVLLSAAASAMQQFSDISVE